MLGFNWRLLCIFSCALATPVAFAAERPPSSLPPNWETGSRAKVRMMPMQPMGADAKRVGKKETHEASVMGDETSWSIGAALSTPELLRLDLRYQATPSWGFHFSAGPGWPFTITVEMPSDVIQADKSNTLATAYPAFDADFEATWGPHVLASAAWHPFAGAWYLTLGGGMRQLSIKGSAESAVRICTIAEAKKEPPCANDQASLQTRNRLRISADATLTSTLMQATTGWLWHLSPQWETILALGAVKPIKTTTKVNANAEIITPDGAPEEVSGALADLKGKSERDVADKAEHELRGLSEATIPVLTFGVAYRF